MKKSMALLSRIIAGAAAALALAAISGCKMELGNQDDRASISGYAVTGIVVTDQKTEFQKNDEFTLGNGKVEATFANGEKEYVTNDVIQSGFSSATVSDSVKVTLSYTSGGKTVTTDYTVSITNSVSSIAIKTVPTTTAGTVYAAPDLTGMVVTVTYEDNSTKDVAYDDAAASFTASPAKFTEAGTVAVTVTYAGKTASYNATVGTVTDAAVASYALDGDDTGLEIVGSGTYVADETFTKVYQNVGGAQRTNYLNLGDVMEKVVGADAITIGFWVKGTSTGEFWSPLAGVYGSTDNTNGGLWLEARGVLGVNWGGVFYDYGNDAQNIAWLETTEDGATTYDWHYYTCVISNDGSATVFVDGKVLFTWPASAESAAGVAGFFSNLDTLNAFCLGGNQAWSWGDNDTPYSYAKFSIWDTALTPEQIASVVAAK